MDSSLVPEGSQYLSNIKRRLTRTQGVQSSTQTTTNVNFIAREMRDWLDHFKTVKQRAILDLYRFNEYTNDQMTPANLISTKTTEMFNAFADRRWFVDSESSRYSKMQDETGVSTVKIVNAIYDFAEERLRTTVTHCEDVIVMNVMTMQQVDLVYHDGFLKQLVFNNTPLARDLINLVMDYVT
jgi:hypothetical protein